VVALVFCTTAAETSIGNWLFTFSIKEMGLDDADAALANSSFWGAFTLGRVFGVSCFSSSEVEQELLEPGREHDAWRCAGMWP